MSASDDASRSDESKASGQPSPADRAPQRRWVPRTAALLTFLIGLADILNILRPDLVSRLHRINSMIPGTLTDVTRSADVIIGLTRSEEHTSELQSRRDLVCRLLLEKKNK